MPLAPPEEVVPEGVPLEFMLLFSPGLLLTPDPGPAEAPDDERSSGCIGGFWGELPGS